jgi:hypothetical protein
MRRYFISAGNPKIQNGGRLGGWRKKHGLRDSNAQTAPKSLQKQKPYEWSRWPGPCQRARRSVAQERRISRIFDTDGQTKKRRLDGVLLKNFKKLSGQSAASTVFLAVFCAGKKQ